MLSLVSPPSVIRFDAAAPLEAFPDFPETEISSGARDNRGHLWLDDPTAGLEAGVWESEPNLGRWMAWPVHEFMKRLWAVIAVLGLAACGKETVATGDGTSTTYSTNPSSLVVRVETTGGFVPVETIFTNLPVVSIYGDGRVITTGPQVMPAPSARSRPTPASGVSAAARSQAGAR